MPFPLLFSPLRLRGVTLRNRVVSTAHGTTMSEGGLPTEATAAYHGACAAGGAGLIILEAAAVHETAVYNDRFLSCHTDAAIDPFRRVIEAVHGHGATVFGQLYHPGASMRGSVGGARLVAVGPSYAPAELSRTQPRTLTVAMIGEIVRAFGNAAARMLAAGADGIEINGRGGNLPAQFLNPASNHRTDAYGGTYGHRLRFLAEIVDEVRRHLGPERPLGLRISGTTQDADDLDSDELVRACRDLVREGVDYLNVIAGSIGSYAGVSHIVPPMGLANGYVAPRAAAIRAAVGCPVLVAGRITRPEQAERLLVSGAADLCGMTRALIADPEMPAKAAAGRTDDIRECIGCNQACIGHEPLGAPVSCIQRPETGRELSHGRRVAAPHRHHIVVVGGGPAGLKAAAVAAERGHGVTLLERERVVGGQANLAALLPGRSEFGGIVTNLAREARGAGATIRTGVTADAALIGALAPDAVILATGARPYHQPLEGDGLGMVDAWSVLRDQANVGASVVIADSRCDWIGIGLAVKLARAGCRVRLCVTGDTAGQEIETFSRYLALADLHRLGVAIQPHVRVVGRADGAVHLRWVTTGEVMTLDDVDTLVLTQGHEPESELETALRPVFPGPIHVIGDCLGPRTAEEAVLEGFEAGLAV